MSQLLNHEEKRIQVRAAVVHLLNHLRTFAKWTFKVDDLIQLGVGISRFDPFDLNEAIIFQPLTEQELSEYDVDEVLLHTDIIKKLDLENWTPPQGADGNASRRNIDLAAMKDSQHVYEFFEAMYSCFSSTYEPKEPLSMSRPWTDIPVPHPDYNWPPELGKNSWPRDPGLLSHHDIHPEHVGWTCEMVSEWKERLPRGPPLIQPHVRMVVCHGTTGDQNGVLLGELAAIAQVILNRLNQPHFNNEYYFPVLMFSFFGPRHGRILEAVCRPCGKLDLRVTPVYDFTKIHEAPIEMFMRYLASSPRRDDHY